MADFVSYRMGLTLLDDRLTRAHDPVFQFASEPFILQRGIDDSLIISMSDAKREICEFCQQARKQRVALRLAWTRTAVEDFTLRD